MAFFLRRQLPAAAGLCALAGTALGFGTWNYKVGTYFENLDGFEDFDLQQAIVTDPVDRAAVIAPSWEITQPAASPPGSATGIPFSGGGSATYFAAINSGGIYGEQVRLFQRWYSAAKDMLWRDNCAGGKDVGNLKLCCVFPYDDPDYESLGGQGENPVLLVPDVRQFNDCHEIDPSGKIECVDGIGVIKGSYPEITELYIRKQDNLDILLAGANYNATWWLRSPGEHPVPGVQLGKSPYDVRDTYNNRLVSMKMDFRYYNSEIKAWVENNYLAGATQGYQAPGNAECSDTNLGCPMRLILEDQQSYDPQHAMRRYISEEVDSPYTPYTFSFCLGKLAAFPASNVGTNVRCYPCSYDEGRPQMNDALCKEKPDGELRIFLTTHGMSPEENTEYKCPGNEVEVPYVNCRAAASLYIDGMMLTAGEGSYLSPVFDSLSPYTAWTYLAWESVLNPDSLDVPRTPININYNVAADGSALGAADLGAAENLSAEAGTIALSATSVGRYFRYQADLISWDMNKNNYPALPVVSRFKNTCLRYNPEHDGSLSPALWRISLGYTPYAGQLVTKVLRPSNLKRWERLTFDAETTGGASVTADVLGENMVPAVMEDGTVLTGVSSGVLLSRLDPAKYPNLRIRFVLSKENSLANQARLRWFKLEYEPMKERLALNRNAVRLGRGETVEIRFMSKAEGITAVRIYDGAGQLVRELFRGELKPEEIYQESWDGTGRDGSQVAPGVFFVTLVAPDASETLRLAVMR